MMLEVVCIGLISLPHGPRIKRRFGKRKLSRVHRREIRRRILRRTFVETKSGIDPVIGLAMCEQSGRLVHRSARSDAESKPNPCVHPEDNHPGRRSK